MDNQKESWEESYRRKENFVYYPHEEVIRFFSKYVAKRTGLDSVVHKYGNNETPAKVLDLGCGIGRHVIFAHEMKTEAYGVDLSETAIEIAVEWAKRKKLPEPETRIRQCDSTKMSFDDNYFDFIISHGVLDSMSIHNCINSLKESARVLKPDGLFYCDLNSINHESDKNILREKIVDSVHEKNTIQLYFDDLLINNTIARYFKIKEKILIVKTNASENLRVSRYHLVLTKN